MMKLQLGKLSQLDPLDHSQIPGSNDQLLL